MPDGDKKLTEGEIREAIFLQFEAKLPRPGRELELFVAETCEYFGIEEGKCRKIIGSAKSAYLSARRVGQQTAGQQIAEVMGDYLTAAIGNLGELMYAVRRRPMLDKAGNPVLGPDGEPMFYETPDNANRIAATKEMLKVVGGYAPKEIRLEATHEHKHDISDSDLLTQFAAMGRALRSRIVEAQYSVEPGRPAENDRNAPGLEAGRK